MVVAILALCWCASQPKAILVICAVRDIPQRCEITQSRAFLGKWRHIPNDKSVGCGDGATRNASSSVWPPTSIHDHLSYTRRVQFRFRTYHRVARGQRIARRRSSARLMLVVQATPTGSPMPRVATRSGHARQSFFRTESTSALRTEAKRPAGYSGEATGDSRTARAR